MKQKTMNSQNGTGLDLMETLDRKWATAAFIGTIVSSVVIVLIWREVIGINGLAEILLLWYPSVLVWFCSLGVGLIASFRSPGKVSKIVTVQLALILGAVICFFIGIQAHLGPITVLFLYPVILALTVGAWYCNQRPIAIISGLLVFIVFRPLVYPFMASERTKRSGDWSVTIHGLKNRCYVTVTSPEGTNATDLIDASNIRIEGKVGTFFPLEIGRLSKYNPIDNLRRPKNKAQFIARVIDPMWPGSWDAKVYIPTWQNLKKDAELTDVGRRQFIPAVYESGTQRVVIEKLAINSECRVAPIRFLAAEVSCEGYSDPRAVCKSLRIWDEAGTTYGLFIRYIGKDRVGVGIYPVPDPTKHVWVQVCRRKNQDIQVKLRWLKLDPPDPDQYPLPKESERF